MICVRVCGAAHIDVTGVGGGASFSEDVVLVEFMYLAIYLSKLLHLYTPSRQLYSSADTRVFRIPSFWTKSSCQRSFCYLAPDIWNQFPVSVRRSTSVSFLQILLENLSLLKSLLFSPIALIYDSVCVCVLCVCVRVVCVEFWMHLKKV